MLVLGISGSLRRASHNTQLLHAAGELVEAQAAEFAVFDGLKAVPPYDEDDDRPEALPPAVERLKSAIAEADAVVFATPEYNSSIPGQLKNAIDWASRPIETNPLRNTPVAVVGASTGMFGAVWAQAELRKVLGATGARVVGEEVPVPTAPERFGADGRLEDDEVRAALETLIGSLVAELRPAETVSG